jgi:hypothetical protein
MKKTIKMICLLAVTTFLFASAFACSGTTTTTTGTEEYTLVGEYEIDITSLGMPLIFYLKIDANDNFFLSSDRTYAVDKGHGTIASSGETYMFLYSDSTTEAPKTSTFNVRNRNIYFIASLPYGSSNLQATDDDNPDLMIYPVAKALLFEEYLGVYAGSHTASTIDYEYYLELGTGCEYTFTSDFVSGTAVEFVETGVFSIEETSITLTPENGTAVTGVLNDDDSIDVAVKTFESEVRTSRNLRFATTAAYAGTYYGYLDEIVGDITNYATNAILVLDNFGGYSYSALDAISSQTITEIGTFSVSGTVFTFTPEGQTTLTGNFPKYVVKAAFEVNPESSTREEVWFYRSNIQGQFNGTATVNEVDYTAILNVYADATFDLVISIVGGDNILTQEGTFTVGGFPLSLNLKVGTITTALIISLTNLQGNFVINEVEYGFIFSK